MDLIFAMFFKFNESYVDTEVVVVIIFECKMCGITGLMLDSDS